MSAKTDKLKLEYTKLTDAERSEILRFIQQFENSSLIQKGSLSETLSKSLGPTDANKCSCCGK
jgi:hypothetical protein